MIMITIKTIFADLIVDGKYSHLPPDENLDYLSSEKQRLVIRNVRNEFQLDFAMTDRIY